MVWEKGRTPVWRRSRSFPSSLWCFSSLKTDPIKIWIEQTVECLTATRKLLLRALNWATCVRGPTKPSERPGSPVRSHAGMLQTIRGPSCQQRLFEVWAQASRIEDHLGKGLWDCVQPHQAPFLLWSVGMYLVSYFKVTCFPDPWIQNLRPQVIGMKHFLKTLT